MAGKAGAETAGDNLVVTLGDSRMVYSPKGVDQRPGQTGYVVRTAAVPGSDPRAWYYMLRDLDPTARRYRAIVFGVDDYDMRTGLYNPDDDIRALHYCMTRLRSERRASTLRDRFTAPRCNGRRFAARC